MFFYFIFTLFLFGCVNLVENKYLNTNLANKNTKEILSFFPDYYVYFIGEPPCSLSKVKILSRENKILVTLRYKNLPVDMVERIPSCNWKIEEFYKYTPSEIFVESVDDDYIRRSNVKH